MTNNEPLQINIARSNGIPPLIELLSANEAATQAGAARLLWHLSGNQESGAAIVAAGGLAPLCSMLSHELVNLEELAATVLSRLFKANASIAQSAAEVYDCHLLLAPWRRGPPKRGRRGTRHSDQ